MADISQDGQITVEDQIVGRLTGFRFIPDPSESAVEGKALRAAAEQILGDALAERAKALMDDEVKAISISEQGALLWKDEAVATLVKGAEVLAPQVKLLVDDYMAAATAEKLLDYLQTWTFMHLRTELSPLYALRDSASLEGIAKGVGFRIVEGLGSVERSDIAKDLKELDQDARGGLRALAVRFAEYTVHIPAMLKPAAARLKLILWALYNEIGEVPDPPQPGLVTIAADDAMPKGYYSVTGFRHCGPVAIRTDMVERIADALRPLTKRDAENPKGEFLVNPDLMSLAGRSGDDFAEILKSLGYRQRSEEGEDGQISVFWSRKPPKRAPSRPVPEKKAAAAPGKPPKKKQKAKKPEREPRPVKIDPNSPFAALAGLKEQLGSGKPKS